MAHEVATGLDVVHAKETLQEALAKFDLPDHQCRSVQSIHGHEFTRVVFVNGAKLSMDG